MSPEILMGEEFGLSSDSESALLLVVLLVTDRLAVFSLGVIFCELLSRHLADERTFAVSVVAASCSDKLTTHLAAPTSQLRCRL